MGAPGSGKKCLGKKKTGDRRRLADTICQIRFTQNHRDGARREALFGVAAIRQRRLIGYGGRGRIREGKQNTKIDGRKWVDTREKKRQTKRSESVML